MDTVTSCYLCDDSIILENGDKSSYLDHLSVNHGITCNVNFVVSCNFINPNIRSNIESLLMSIIVQSDDGQEFTEDSSQNNDSAEELLIDENQETHTEEEAYVNKWRQRNKRQKTNDDCEEELLIEEKDHVNVSINKRKKRNPKKQQKVKTGLLESNLTLSKLDFKDSNVPSEECSEAEYNNPTEVEMPDSMGNICEESMVEMEEEIQIKEENEESPFNPFENMNVKSVALQIAKSSLDIKVSSEDKCLPPGWKVKTVKKRGRPSNGNTKMQNNQFISPEGKVFTNFKEVEKNMKDMGIYTEDDIMKARGYIIYMNIK